MTNKCKIKGFQELRAVNKSKGKYIIYLGNIDKLQSAGYFD